MTQKPTFHKRGHRNLVQSIRAAMTELEVAQFLHIGSTFAHASDKTRSRWHEAAKQRLGELRK